MISHILPRKFRRTFRLVSVAAQITPLDASARRFGAIMLFKFRGAVL